MSPLHLNRLRQQLLSLQILPPPDPWHERVRMQVAGLRGVGFDRTSELLLVVSDSGRSVIDCKSGRTVASDTDEYYEDEGLLEATGIGPLEGRTVRMSGSLGGGLPISTADGWSVECIALEWPSYEYLLMEPFASVHDSFHWIPGKVHKIGRATNSLAFGFSYVGASLVVATPCDVTVYGRKMRPAVRDRRLHWQPLKPA